MALHSFCGLPDCDQKTTNATRSTNEQQLLGRFDVKYFNLQMISINEICLPVVGHDIARTIRVTNTDVSGEELRVHACWHGQGKKHVILRDTGGRIRQFQDQDQDYSRTILGVGHTYISQSISSVGFDSNPHLRFGPPMASQVKRILARESIWWQICRQSIILNHRFELDNRRFGLDNWGLWAAPCLQVELPPDVIISGRGCSTVVAKYTEKYNQ